MAGPLPDPRSLNSWEDAFQHPLPVVRKLEQQLRKNIDDNRQKLRSLVGASYRDLLGTAERIIEMDQQMETVESNLGDIARRCNARTVEKIAENSTQMRKTLNARDGDKYAALAQTKVLQSALTMATRIVKVGGDALQASKLLVLSRLLFKSLSDGSQPPSVLEELRRKLATLRKRVLSYITTAMVKPSEDKNSQVHTLCAYALVTSSTPKDVLRHFLQVRFEQLDSRSDSPSENDILEMVDLYSQTLLDTRDLFPRRFSESLAQLAKHPLIRDEQVQSLFELNLDIYGQWISDDVRAFTPWVRHDQLGSGEVTEALTSWTKQAQQCLLRGVQEFVDSQGDVHVVSDARKKVLAKYMSLSGKLRSEDHMKTIHALRETFLVRLRSLAAESAAFSDLDFLKNPSGQEQGDSKISSIWDLASEDLDLDHGAVKFRRSIVHQRNSRTTAIQAAGEKLDNWISRIDGILDLTDGMRTDKWDTDLDFDLDDIDDSDALVATLNQEDPESLRAKLQDAVAATLNDLGHHVLSDQSNPTFYIRVWREVGRRHRALESRLTVPVEKVSLSPLHQSLAQTVVEDPIKTYCSAVSRSSHVAVELWDGTPPVPVQPSPATFRFLKTLHQAMASVGNDLWSSNAVREVQSQVLKTLSTELENSRFTSLVPDSNLTNGHGEEGDKEEEENESTGGADAVKDSRRQGLLQNLFDIHYLRRVFGGQALGDAQREDLSNVVKAITQELEPDEAAIERLEKSASEYWRRTYLLFGLLAK